MRNRVLIPGRSTRILALLTLIASAARADSPLSSTDLASAYNDLAVVRDVRTSRELDADALTLLVGAAPADRKAAVVNALGWGGDGFTKAIPFVKAVAVARGVGLDDLRLDHLTATDRFVLGYLLAMGEASQPLRPVGTGVGAPGDLWNATPRELLAQAASALPADFTVQYVRALVEAQDAMTSSWCGVYMATKQVLDRFPVAKRNLRPKAVAAAQSYIDLYKKECGAPPTSAAALGKRTPFPPEANQIYALARLGTSVLAATQWGAVVWDPSQKEPTASRREELCAAVVAWRDAGWFGCEARVVRFDGSTWKSYLHQPGADGEQYDLAVDPRGSLLARYGSEVHEYDPAGDTFKPSRISLGEKPSAAIVRANGEVWWIDFMRAVHGPKGSYPVGSPEYPASDPRDLVEDEEGRLWVTDFKAGVLRLQDDGRFLREPGLEDQGSGVALDTRRGRLWLLHYTNGPVLVTGDAPPRPFDTKDLEYMRDLLVDPDGSVWIAGWNKLLRLRDTPQGWKREELVAK
jgi:streptogramin lyase